MSTEYLHKTKEGTEIPIIALSDDHLKNIIKYIKCKAKRGMSFQYGGGNTADEMWYDEETIYGKKVKKHLHYKVYKDELKRRNLTL